MILITGGTGFVGKWLARAGAYCIGRDEYQRGEWQDVVWDGIIHAAHVTPTEVIACAKRSNARLTLISSGAVYHHRLNVYGEAKRDYEAEVQESGIDYTIARLFTFAGRGLAPHFAVSMFILEALMGGPITVLGSGNVTRSYMYGAQMAEWIWAIHERGKRGGVYDVGSSEAVTIRQLAREVARNFKPVPEVRILNKIQFEQAPVYVPQAAHITRQELGLAIPMAFEEVIRLAVEDYLHES